MRRAMRLALALLLAVTASPAAQLPAPVEAVADLALPAPEDIVRPDSPLSAAGRYIVVLKDASGGARTGMPGSITAIGTAAQTARSGRVLAAASARAARLGIHLDRTYSHALLGYSASLDATQLAALHADPDVASIVPDEVISIAGQSTPTGIRRVNGKESLVAGIDGSDERVDADVAILDTGIGGTTSRSHEDLNIAGGVSCSTTDLESWGDPNGHGTHVAGTVGALDNGIGVVGVAPGVRLWSVRIMDPAGNGLVSWYVCGLDWVTAQRDPLDPDRPLFEAANMSVARKGTDDGSCGLFNNDVIHQAVCRLVATGVTVVAAAGNDGFNAANLRPASYDEVITVSALADTDGKPGGLGGPLCYSWGTYDHDDTFADFSNYGSDIDLIAPGKCIRSTLPGNRYGYISGTSMAAPHVTGAVALYKASRPLATPAEVRLALRAAGTQDWKTATDPDAVHEPLLDVSHIVALGDWTLDATPGTSRSVLVGAAGTTVALPVSLFRAEDFPDAVTLSVSVDAPVSATLQAGELQGQDANATTMDVAVPADTPSGTYTVTVRGTDGARVRTSTFPVTVDSVRPTATAPSLTLRRGSVLGTSVGSIATWSAAADPGGTIGRYEVRWRVDGTLGVTTALSATVHQTTRSVVPGHTYALRVRARDAAGNWSPWTESRPLNPAVAQDTSGTLARSSGWTRYHLSKMSGGTSLHARKRGAWISRSFTGRAIALVAPKSAKRGKATIYIDGIDVGTVDLYRSSPLFRVVVFTRTWRTPGPHTIKVVVRGTAHRPRVDVDAFIVVP